ncbi:MAG: PAS domain-containing sensor histidine kinase, partial [Candidatus Rokuibacteriota bacterium]
MSIIAPDGRVIADSSVPPAELAVVENHAGRPEVQTALRGRQGRDLRTSATVRAPLFYVAMPITEGERVVGVLRVAFPLAIVTASYAALRRDLLIGGAVALAVALAIGIFVSRRITRPVVEMQAIA